MKFAYYLQHYPLSIRRYPDGQQTGERWVPKTQSWSYRCCERSTCEFTKDEVLPNEEAAAAIAAQCPENEH